MAFIDQEANEKAEEIDAKVSKCDRTKFATYLNDPGIDCVLIQWQWHVNSSIFYHINTRQTQVFMYT